MKSTELRKKFLEFFEKREHKVLPSASLAPAETDPSVLFTTAGMLPFKYYYSQPGLAPALRITTIQKCIRTGDIDEVGDNTHLSFFEMMGNFSFGYREGFKGSYFKKDAIALAWEFLTDSLGFEKNRIYATYFEGNNDAPIDEGSLKILESIDGLSNVIPQGFDDNFWSLGTDRSPGGPTVEFYIDGVEIWNLVFNEYVFRDGKYERTQLNGVDTGMGFERLLAMIERVDNVYDTELFQSVLDKISQLSGKNYDENKKEFRIIADHIKAATFAIADGTVPTNKDAGYVVRRLIRRAVVKAREIGIEDNFTTEIAEEVLKTYEGAYEFKIESIFVELEKEESKFRKTLKDGLRVLSLIKNITAKELFNLYQSYGLPIEITIEEAKKSGREINNEAIEQYNNLMREHQRLSRTASAGLFKGGLVESGEMTTKYHTATHLLLAALRQLVSPDIYQRGSNITAERLRLDFNYPERLTPEQIKSLEDLVNAKIAEDLPVEMTEMTLGEAKKAGAMGIFESKYGDKVKVYSIGSFSNEICGGPHVTHTGDLGHFKITKEESSSSGVRRIKAILE